MNHQTAYKDFTSRFKLLISKNPHLITTTLSNVFTMRLIGNKTHGDLAEIAIAEFINQFMYDFKSIHTGKDLRGGPQSLDQRAQELRWTPEVCRHWFWSVFFLSAPQRTFEKRERAMMDTARPPSPIFVGFLFLPPQAV